MFKRLIPFLFLSACLAGSPSAFAEQIGSLYSGTVPISSQQSGERGAGFDSALENVLIKVSGDTRVLEQIRELGVNLPAKSFVQTFSYRENPDYEAYLQAQEAKEAELTAAEQAEAGEVEKELGISLDDEIQRLEQKLAEMQNGESSQPSQESNEETQLPPEPFLLDVSFSESAVNKELTRLNIPVWGKTRPTSILWIVVEEEGERRILGEDDLGGKDYLESLAAKRGLPIFLPVADLQDFSSIDLGDVWALFPGSADVASARYDADAIVMVRAYQTAEGLWEANWNLQHREMLQTGEVLAEDLNTVLDTTVDQLSSMLSSRYAVLRTVEEGSSAFSVKISKVNSFEDYIHVQNYLQTLPPVAQVSLKWVNQDEHFYELILTSSEDQFYEHIELGRKLRREVLSINVEPVIIVGEEGLSDRYLQFETQLQEPAVKLVWLGAGK